MVDPFLIAALVGALVSAVFASLAETALLRASKVRVAALAADGDRRARRLGHLQDRLSHVLNAVLLLALLSQIGAATLAGRLAQDLFGNLGVTIASAVLTLVLFIYGEAIPKTYAVRHAERVALALSGLIALIDLILRPVVTVLVWIADIQAPGRGISTGPTITEAELKLLASHAAGEGEITESDRELIERTFRFGDRRVDDVMVPRTEIVAVSADTSVAEALDVALAAGHRRLPVYVEDLDQIVGIVRLRDLARATDESGIGTVVEKPLVVPESKRVVDLLREMQERRVHFAVVIDEYGGTAGLVTVEDVVEELLGDIGADPRVPDVLLRRDGTWVVEGSVPVEDLAEIFGDDAELEGEWNTAAGLAMGRAGRVLEVGDEVDVGEFRITVEEMSDRRITRLGIARRVVSPESE